MHLMKDIKRAGYSAADHGWRRTAADKIARPIAKHTSARPDQIRMVVGLVFLALSIKFIAGTIMRARKGS